jgi:aminoethylphosphonate catabolism LysR family transcriptional regulator
MQMNYDLSSGNSGSSPARQAQLTDEESMNLAQLRAFHAVAAHGSFSAAAQFLGVSQPAITQHVKSLEESTGVRLFRRSGSRVELTPDAEDLWPLVRQAVLAFDEISLRMDNGRSLAAGNLSLGLCAPHLAMRLIARFLETFPSIRVDVRIENSSRLVELVVNRRVDIGLATLREPIPELTCMPIIDQEVLVLVHRQHPWWDREEVDVAELQQVPLVLREKGSMTRRLFEDGLRQAGIGLTERLTLSSREAVKEAVATGLGLGIVLDQELGCDPRLRGLTVRGAALNATEYLLISESASSSGLVRGFLDLAAQERSQASSPISECDSAGQWCRRSPRMPRLSPIAGAAAATGTRRAGASRALRRRAALLRT